MTKWLSVVINFHVINKDILIFIKGIVIISFYFYYYFNIIKGKGKMKRLC